MLKGEVINRTDDTLLLFKGSMFPIIEAKIPIVYNKFQYSFEFSEPEAYELIFQNEFESGSMNITNFFAEKGEIHFRLNDRGKNDDDNITGHDFNNALNEYELELKRLFWNEIMYYSDILESMSKKDELYSEDWKNLQKRIRTTSDKDSLKLLYNEKNYLKNTKKMFTPQARKYVEIQDSIANAKKLWEFNYVENNTSILSYYMFMRNIKETAKSCCWQPVDNDLIKEAQNYLTRFTSKFPNHPYNQIIKNTLDGLQNIHEGGKFIDFALPNRKGEYIELSKVIKNNKLILLDFWSTWCGPCIKTSREMVPIYHEFKDKGFEVLGITQNYREMEKLLQFMQKENYPWTNVIDVDNKEGIWEKYNLSHSGGATFLIDSSGKIVAVNLTANQIKEKLIEYLN